MTMSLDDYQKLASMTAIYPRESGLSYTALGLAEEAGEIAGQAKRITRDDGGYMTAERLERLTGECGDALWYVSQLAHELGVRLSDVASLNLAKLKDRQARNALKGQGDDR
jgi:NTP pyrophosphatase (non-canonical NTP hydrolase)